MLSFAGIKPIHESLYGLAFADEQKRAHWLVGSTNLDHGAVAASMAASTARSTILLPNAGVSCVRELFVNNKPARSGC
jgi:hypothetical protein